MKKFEGILICTDLDGTLLQDDKSVAPKDLEAIEYFKSEGGAFTIVTGRLPYFIGDIVDRVRPNAPVGCGNGEAVYDFESKKYLHTVLLDRSSLELVDYVMEHIDGLGMHINTYEEILFCRENESMEIFRRLTGVPNITCDYNTYDGEIAKIVFGDTREEAIRLLDKLLTTHGRADEFDFIRSEKMLYEILPKGTNKGASLLKIAEILGIDRKNTIAVGDYFNDIPMIKEAGVGIAVGNARTLVKEAADIVTVSNSENAMARIIEDIDSGKIIF
ncbi:MAG: HAD family phosphatase [Clostridia bacterium]|nr:HAD family phosphatase [Clostridia bacterium]